jgi:cyclopropane fatty-acyl-phospholipid synthase-like methyltransferase
LTDVNIHDHGRPSDWGRTSQDYGRFRPGYPPSFFERITALGIGLPRQRVLDLGTGTGNIARSLARLGCDVTAVDISAEQIEEAERLALQERLDIQFHVRPAEHTELADRSFDVITAAQSWLYFDRDSMVSEVRRLLVPSGKLMTSHIGWLPRQDDVAKRTEELVLKHNPDWTAGDLSGEIPPVPTWIGKDFTVVGFFVYQEAVPFTRESWRGRIRACRAIGASMTPAQVEAFDREHAQLLERTVAENFTVLHWIDAHILVPL